ncbi:hypothetical protein [Mycobacteroides abscessus]|uniref:hypothetical protein n=1 Tax=Mycobacteroides abscessus TaxID=36809 RepID=UPI0009A82EFB|nr:hypothetical protein [Mycobacteroides abscessus]SKO40555.1 Uncharacterised protein [Mycobacteroides abscessus subsp. abscessus]
MTDMHDPYPELPPIPPELRIDPYDLTPESLTPVTTPEQSERAVQAIEAVVTNHIGHRGQRLVDAVTNEVWLHLWQGISEALGNSERFLSEHQGDVTPSD